MADDIIASVDQAILRLAETISSVSIRLSHTDDYDKIQQQRPGHTWRYLFAVGPLAISAWQPGDDIHLICLTTDSRERFRSIVKEGLELENLKVPQGDRYELESLPGAPQIVRSSRVCIHYARLTTGVRVNNVEQIRKINGRAVFGAFQKLINEIHMVCDLRESGQLAGFRADWLQLRSWATSMGIIEPSLGLLSTSRLFDIAYGIFRDWEKRVVTDPNLQPPPSFLETFFFNIQHNALDTFNHASLNLVKVAFTEAVQHVQSAVEYGSSTREEMLAITSQQSFEAFLQENDMFLVLLIERFDFTEPLQESEASVKNYVAKWADQQNLAGSFARLWPVSSIDGPQTKYLVGIQNTSATKSPLDKQDVSGCIITTTKCTRPEVAQHFPAPHQSTESTRPTPAPASIPSRADSKFRPASSVLSRLRWDPAHSGIEWEVGYIDRFEGLKWIALASWGKQTEEEDFIPEHRIKQVRRKDDGSVVWDRERRLDLTGEVI